MEKESKLGKTFLAVEVRKGRKKGGMEKEKEG